MGDNHVVGHSSRNLIITLTEHLQQAGSTVLDDPAGAIRQVHINLRNLGVEEGVGHGNNLVHVNMVINTSVEAGHDHVDAILLTSDVERVARVFHQVKLVVTLVTVTGLVGILITHAGDILGVSKQVEILIEAVEREHGAVVGNHIPEGGLAAKGGHLQGLTLDITDPLILAGDGHRTVFLKGHHIDVTRLIAVGIILHLPLSTLIGKDISKIISGILKTRDSVLVKDFIGLIFARHQGHR